MLDRRQLLAGTAGTAALAATGSRAATSSEKFDEELDRVLTRQFERNLDRNPELATALGYDKGPRARLKARLNDRSPAAAERRIEDLGKDAAELEAMPKDQLSRHGAVSFDTAGFTLSTRRENAKRFRWGAPGGRPLPYIVSQLDGAYYSVPNLLTNQHAIETRDDAEAYVTRLKAFGQALDQDTECVRRDAGLGVIAPDFILSVTIGNLRKLRDQSPANSPLVRSLADRARAKGLGDYEAVATQALSTVVAPALDRQIAALESLKPRASHDAGIWRLPDGEGYYAAAMVDATTITIRPDQVHEIGLHQVEEIGRQLEPLLQSRGLTQGTVGARLAALNADPAALYPNTDPGKSELIAYLNSLIAGIQPGLSRAFSTLPRTALEIRRVPAQIEAGAPLGYYEAAPLDGSRRGIYYINLKNTADWPKWTLPTLSYHEGVPGHHFQISIARESADLPVYRRTAQFPAYTEGWALYAEQLADELGAYQQDAPGRIGYLQSQLFRSVRLVVDTGIHAKRWGREQAIRYMVETAGRTLGASTNEVERYCVWPGQACSYKLGHLLIAQLRSTMAEKLGRRFDLKAFHQTVLSNGAMPLSILERVVEDWGSRKLMFG